MEIIRFDHVGLTIKESQILDNVSFSTEQGEIVGIAGPSGSGKTSLLRLMNLLRSPTTGTIFYKDATSFTMTLPNCAGKSAMSCKNLIFSTARSRIILNTPIMSGIRSPT